MKIKLKKKGTKVSDEDIQRLEAELGFSLSKSFKDFVQKHDQAKFEDNVFKVGEHQESGVHELVPVSQIASERECVENLPSRGYPVAWDAFGNYIFIDEGKKGAVYFWDHELPDEITKIADNFDAFLSILEPDTDPVELKPGQVKSVWTHPDFAKLIKEED